LVYRTPVDIYGTPKRSLSLFLTYDLISQRKADPSCLGTLSYMERKWKLPLNTVNASMFLQNMVKTPSPPLRCILRRQRSLDVGEDDFVVFPVGYSRRRIMQSIETLTH